MPDFYSEPFIHLAGLTPQSALIAWGAFYFRVKNASESFKLVDDDSLKHIHPPRHETIGARSEPYGEATVRVMDKNGNVVAIAIESAKNHVWVLGLDPDTEYTYEVRVNGEEWAHGPRRNWERTNGKMGLGPKTRSYDNRFRTHPAPTSPSPGRVTFAVIGDFGVGVKKDDDRGQRLIAAALERAVNEHSVRFILTTGDNIYRRGAFLGIIGGETGDEDDDWYFTYHQAYRYVINRVPVYPSIGNHDADETEDKDDRSQLIDNLYLRQRIEGEEISGCTTDDIGLFYRLRFGADVELICIDTSREPALFDNKKRLFEHPHQRAFLEAALPDVNVASSVWRIPFCHHPPFCAGPRYGNTKGMEGLITQFERAGVRLLLSGHEHNFQHSRLNSVNYIVTGGAGKLRTGQPGDFDDAHTISWAAEYHFLLVTIEGRQVTVRAVGALDNQGGLVDIGRREPNGSPVEGAIVVTLP